MTDRFDAEFYRNSWHRVLPLAPDGIQPFVWSGEQRGNAPRLPGWRRLAAAAWSPLRAVLELGGAGNGMRTAPRPRAPALARRA
jgi:hypothetical protein